jgi:hypothetical protein
MSIKLVSGAVIMEALKDEIANAIKELKSIKLDLKMVKLMSN